MSDQVSIPKAIEVFVHAFSQGKSMTYPYVPHFVDGMWIMRDTPDRKNARKIEIISYGIEPKSVVDRIQKHDIGWHFLCEIHRPEDDFDAIRAEYKSLGYKAVSTEWLFVHSLENIPEFSSTPEVRLVEDQATMDSIPMRGSQRRKLRAGAQHYSIWDDETDYGWVYSVPVGENAWVADLHVHDDLRGRGYGKALMSKLLQDDKALGIQNSVLLASSLGARIYPTLGYQQIGILQMFCPAKRS